MHREISRADEVFGHRSDAGLYLLTALLAGLLVLDLGPWLINRLGPGFAPSWPREIFGYRWALIAAVIGGVRTLHGSINSLLDGRLGADLALAIACIAAILINEPLVAAEIVVIGLIGECLESFTFHRTQNAVRKLAEVFPRRCWLLRDGVETRVFTHELKVGDRVIVKPGAKIPVDGTVIDGRSSVNVSTLTGESLPVDRGAGDAVLAGGVNLHGALTVEATKVGDQTVAGRVIEMTARALRDKSPVERTADRLARWFLPTVLVLAGLTFAANFIGQTRFAVPKLDATAAVRKATYPALAVLVVACPCALILATPAAVIAALGRLAGTGVLLKSGAALERLAGVKSFAFDKTGTLTEGQLYVGFVSDDAALEFAATAERRSEHPIATAILAEATSLGITPEPPTDFRAEPGGGVIARTDSHTIHVGTRRFVQNHSISTDLFDTTLTDVETRGFTPLVVARDGTAVGVIGVGDRIRADAPAVVAELRALGVECVALISGDRKAVAESVAAAVGITAVYAEQLPTDKAELLATLPAPVAFVGDGVNDAPALARAAVGLAVGSGTDIAAEAGDIVLMGDPLKSLPLLLRLSRATMKIIRQNIIAFAFVVNFIGVALTAWLWPLFATSPEWYEASPLAAAIYHQAGSLLVLLNSMRLLAFERSASPRLVAWRDRLRAADQWIGRHLDAGEWLHELGHRWRLALASVTALSLVAWAASGLTVIGPGEVGIVKRFGRVSADDLTPGLHWCWPWPVEVVAKFSPDRVSTLEIGFRSKAASAALTWGSPHDVTAFADEAEMVTGDGNLVELQAAVAYRVNRPRVYLETAADPELQLRAAAEAVWRSELSGRMFHELLTTRREELQRRVAERLQPDADKLGLELTAVSLRDLHPPRDAVESFHQVARSMEERDRQINLAEAVAIRQRRDAASQGQRAVRQAQAEAVELRRSAEATRDGFFARLAARDALAADEQARLAADAVVNGWHALASHLAAIDRARSVTEARLAWQAIAEALGRRDKILLDADGVPGRRQVWLFDPEIARPLTRPGREPLTEARP